MESSQPRTTEKRCRAGIVFSKLPYISQEAKACQEGLHTIHSKPCLHSQRSCRTCHFCPHKEANQILDVVRELQHPCTATSEALIKKNEDM